MYLNAVVVGWMIQTNCYLLGDEQTREAAVIDPGDDGAKLAELLKEAGYRPVMVLLTHGHFDHVNGVRPFLEAAGSMPVYLSRRDYPTCPTGFGISAMDGLGALPEAKFLQEGDILQLGHHTIRVLETPGHTPGGLTYQVEDLLFTGDTLFAGSCGRTDFANSDPSAMLASLKKLGTLAGDFRVLPGHMDQSTLERERKDNPYLRQAMGR